MSEIVYSWTAIVQYAPLWYFFRQQLAFFLIPVGYGDAYGKCSMALWISLTWRERFVLYGNCIGRYDKDMYLQE